MGEMREKNQEAFWENGGDELPDKVKLILQATIELYNSGMEFHAIKVSEIAAQAGIGKGTVYEYFRSKDEVIIKAVVFELKWELERLKKAVLEAEDFDHKFMVGANWVLENAGKNFIMERLFKPKQRHINLDETLCEQLKSYINSDLYETIIEDMIISGEREKRFCTPKTKMHRNAAVGSAFLTIMNYVNWPSEFLQYTKEEVLAASKEIFIRVLE